jgi:hypothetical protein
VLLRQCQAATTSWSSRTGPEPATVLQVLHSVLRFRSAGRGCGGSWGDGWRRCRRLGAMGFGPSSEASAVTRRCGSGPWLEDPNEVEQVGEELVSAKAQTTASKENASDTVMWRARSKCSTAASTYQGNLVARPAQPRIGGPTPHTMQPRGWVCVRLLVAGRRERGCDIGFGRGRVRRSPRLVSLRRARRHGRLAKMMAFGCAEGC